MKLAKALFERKNLKVRRNINVPVNKLTMEVGRETSYEDRRSMPAWPRPQATREAAAG
jgi:hypothetical protein